MAKPGLITIIMNKIQICSRHEPVLIIEIYPGHHRIFLEKEQCALAPKCQVKYLYYAWDFKEGDHHNHILLLTHLILQAELNMKESQVTDLRQNIKSQQSETSKAMSELKTALEETEN